MFVVLSIFVLVLSTSECCPDGYFRASQDTCFHIASPTTDTKEAYCSLKGGGVPFGRPLTEEYEKALAEDMEEMAKGWMPKAAWVGMELSGRDNPMGPKETDWKFSNDGGTFDPNQYELWTEFPASGEDCGSVSLNSEFKVDPAKCGDMLAILCKKDMSPCDRGLQPYVLYEEHCLSLTKDNPTMHDNAKTGCSGGHLLPIRQKLDLEAVWQAFHNGAFEGGIYVGLDKENDDWVYKNGEKETKTVSSGGQNNEKCGYVRLLKNSTLGYFALDCEPKHTWFMCEIHGEISGKYKSLV
ncbi:hypothetical protein JTE90_004117 [Oedothorax gibbosus]|uniref:C-type lectin domain-containing protein n=1 Tax=Oedothorax gibbosus TaxID=931172 RepID=A0AAV6V1A5_9ARAC|nr:hypothetical protein JTE90_004117 [Oedothorax gibbosus]